jgi:hypothetical protein
MPFTLPQPSRPLLAWAAAALVSAAFLPAARAADPAAPEPAASAASAPDAAASAPAEAASAPILDPKTGQAEQDGLPKRIEQTLQTWEDFLNGLLVDAFGADPERRYRSDGKRKLVDLGKRWTLALDDRAVGRVGTAGVGIPAAGQPARTWEITHDGNINDLRFYNHKDGTGRENGGSVVTTLAPGWSLQAQGLKLHDDDSGIRRTDGQVGLRYGPGDWWVEGFARGAGLDDTELRENWGDPKPKAAFGGVQTQWEAAPGLTLSAQHQRAIRPSLLPEDERLAGPRTEFGADYRLPGWTDTRVYWREATQLSLLSSAGLEERATYKRVIGAETSEGSKDGLIYAQVRQRSLLDDEDALLVLGWRHTWEIAPKWSAQTLIETGIPIGGENAIKSNTFDFRVLNDNYPNHAFSAEVQAVRTPIKDTNYVSTGYTKRLGDSVLTVVRFNATGVQPHENPRNDPSNVPVNNGDFTAGIGWQEPEERNFSTFLRYSLLGRDAVNDEPYSGIADRVAHIVYSENIWQATPAWNLMLRASRRWDRDESVNNRELRTTNLIVPRVTRQIAPRWRLSVHLARLNDSLNPKQNGWGTELSVQLNRKIVLALGYNPRGVDDGELAGDDRLGKGVRLRLYIPVEATLTHWLKKQPS